MVFTCKKKGSGECYSDKKPINKWRCRPSVVVSGSRSLLRCGVSRGTRGQATALVPCHITRLMGCMIHEIMLRRSRERTRTSKFYARVFGARQKQVLSTNSLQIVSSTIFLYPRYLGAISGGRSFHTDVGYGGFDGDGT